MQTQENVIDLSQEESIEIERNAKQLRFHDNWVDLYKKLSTDNITPTNFETLKFRHTMRFPK